MSTKTGTPPRSTNAFAVDTNVKEGMTISSPGSTSSSSAASSSAAVAECTSRAEVQPSSRSSHEVQSPVNFPPAESWPREIASAMYACSRPTTWARLNGM
jgi:hypothetical protein